MQERQEMSMRALCTGVWTTAAAAALMNCYRPHWTPGFLGGAALSLFSLFSLRSCVRWMFRPGARRSVRAFLGIALLFKLPIYAVGLYQAIRATGCTTGGVLATLAGAGLIPTVIVFKVLGETLVRPAPAKSSAAVSSAVPAVEAPLRVPALPTPGHDAVTGGARGPQTALYSFGKGVS